MSQFPDPNSIDLTFLKGDTGIGQSGATGATYYPYIAYATDAIGSGWSITASGKSHFAIVYSTTLYEPINETQFNALTPQWIDFTEDIATLWNSTTWTSLTGTPDVGWTNGVSARKVGNLIEFKGGFIKTSSGSIVTVSNTDLYDTQINVPSGYEPSSLAYITLQYLRTQITPSLETEARSIVGYVSVSGRIFISREYIFGSTSGTFTYAFFNGASYYTS